MRIPDPIESVSPLTRAMIESLLVGSVQRAAPMQKTGPDVRLFLADPQSTEITEIHSNAGTKRTRRVKKTEGPSEDGPPSLTKSILNVLNGQGKDSVERLAFETDPASNNTYASVYKSKVKLIPDQILKRIAIQDDLVAAIVNTRSMQLQAFGRPQPDRHSTGFKIVPDELVLDKMGADEKKQFEERLAKAEKIITTCGETRGWADKERMTFAQYLGMSTRNAVTVGRIATEVIYVEDASAEKGRRFHSFRPIDAGTIYAAVPVKEAAQAVRDQAKLLLEQIKNEEFEPERFTNDEYAWVQVHDGRPLQAFSEDECVVHNFYPVTDIELDGYPVTPIDTAISAVTTHINITTHNKMYFQTGRAARGMLVIQSDDVSEDTVTRIKHQFQASINNVNNAWRMPVFAVGAEDQISWQAIDSGTRDMEFQYLSDTNARVIMSAFQISPEELPGYQHLSRGTNNQALSESNNEYKLEAARDVGIRPLIAQFEDFFNSRILPLIDSKLAEFCVIKFVGLDAETPEKESVRLQQDMAIHMTYDEVLGKVEKKPVGLEMGGQLPLNAVYSQKLDAYFTVGQILKYFCGVKGADTDPLLNYRRDPFWFQQVQVQMAQQQMQQQAAAQAAGGGKPPEGGGDDGGGGGDGPPKGDGDGVSGSSEDAEGDSSGGQDTPPEQSASGEQSGGGELSSGLDQVLSVMKSEKKLPRAQRKILHQHKQTLERFSEAFDEDLRKLTDEVLDVASDFQPKE